MESSQGAFPGFSSSLGSSGIGKGIGGSQAKHPGFSWIFPDFSRIFPGFSPDFPVSGFLEGIFWIAGSWNNPTSQGNGRAVGISQNPAGSSMNDPLEHSRSSTPNQPRSLRNSLGKEHSLGSPGREKSTIWGSRRGQGLKFFPSGAIPGALAEPPFPTSCNFHGNCGHKFHGNPMATAPPFPHPGGGRGPGMLSLESSFPCLPWNSWNSQPSWSSAWGRRDRPRA